MSLKEYTREEFKDKIDELRESEEKNQALILKLRTDRLIWEIVAKLEGLEERLNFLESQIREVAHPVQEILELEIIPKREAVAKVKKYVEDNPGCTTSQMIEDLRLDPILVVEILKELERKKKIKGEESEPL